MNVLAVIQNIGLAEIIALVQIIATFAILPIIGAINGLKVDISKLREELAKDYVAKSEAHLYMKEKSV